MTKRERLHPEIKRLREDEGLMWREIGERLGISLKTANDYYRDPDGAQHRARHKDWDAKDRVAGSCPACGGVMRGSSVRAAAAKCVACYRAEMSAAKRERMDDIRTLWEEGASERAIADYLGYGPNSKPPILSEMMSLGIIQARREGYRRKHELRRAA